MPHAQQMLTSSLPLSVHRWETLWEGPDTANAWLRGVLRRAAAIVRWVDLLQACARPCYSPLVGGCSHLLVDKALFLFHMGRWQSVKWSDEPGIEHPHPSPRNLALPWPWWRLSERQ